LWIIVVDVVVEKKKQSGGSSKSQNKRGTDLGKNSDPFFGLIGASELLVYASGIKMLRLRL